MLLASHTSHAPWQIVKSDDKKKARLNCIKHILNFIDYDKKNTNINFDLDNNVIYNGFIELDKMK